MICVIIRLRERNAACLSARVHLSSRSMLFGECWSDINGVQPGKGEVDKKSGESKTSEVARVIDLKRALFERLGCVFQSFKQG